MLKRKILNMTTTLLLILIFTFSMTAMLFCQSDPSPFKPAYDYLALGDSYSAGQTPYDVTVGYSYSDVIRDKLKTAGILGDYHKKGVSGYTTTDLLNQLRSMKKLLYQADIVTVDIGINDILQLEEVTAYFADPSVQNLEAAQKAASDKIPEIDFNIRTIISNIKDANPYVNPQIYIMGYFNACPGLPKLLPIIERLNTAIREAADDTDITYVGTMEAIDENIKQYLPGDIHPTLDGYRAIAEEFWKPISMDFMAGPSAYTMPNDIEGHWAEDIIKKYMGRRIIAGYDDGSFKPDRAITRVEFVTILNNYFNLTATAEIEYTDVPENTWYRTEIQKAVKAGYLSGYEDNNFRANEYITRQEAAVAISRIIRFEPPAEDINEAQFNDGQDIPLWSKDAVFALISSGILKGYPDNYIRYKGNLTRAEMLSILDNITEYIHNNTPID